MTTITVEVTEEQAEQLTRDAERLNMSLNDLIVQRLVPRETAQTEGSDAEFEAAMEYVFQKNSELYRRLA